MGEFRSEKNNKAITLDFVMKKSHHTVFVNTV